MSDKSKQQREEKKLMILSTAKQVFIEKGFAAVTMKTIIEVCGISRGGIYLYFKSVDEIFIQVIYMHNEKKLKEAQYYVSENKTFKQLIDEYFEKQKKRLLNINKSLLIAMYEYRFAHRNDYDKDFFNNQLTNTKAIVLAMLNYGVQQGAIKEKDIDALAMNIVFFIEGISMLGTAAGISEEVIDSQIDMVKNMIFRHQI